MDVRRGLAEKGCYLSRERNDRKMSAVETFERGPDNVQQGPRH